MSNDFRGIYPAFLTPLDQDGELIEETVGKMLQFLMASGVDGTYIAGSTGEGTRLPLSQRKQLAAVVSDNLPEDKKLFVHVGSDDIKDAIELAEHAAKVGAHAVSSLPPKGNASGVRSYYEQLAAASPLPLILYYFPKVAPAAFTDPEDLLRVSEIPNVSGVKFTDFNLHLMQRLVKRGVMVFNGYDEVFAAGLLMGAQGGIGSTYNLMPQVYLEIYRAAMSGEWITARTWQSRSNDVLDVMLRYPFFPALRAAMALKGFDCGPMLSGEAFESDAQRNRFFEDLNDNMPPEVAELIGWNSSASVV